MRSATQLEEHLMLWRLDLEKRLRRSLKMTFLDRWCPPGSTTMFG